MMESVSEGLIVEVHLDENDEPPHAAELDREAVAALVRQVLTAEGVASAAVGIVFCGDERISGLNEEWIGHPGPTDVIAFPLHEGAPGPDDAAGHAHADPRPASVEGEVYIDLAQAARQAPEFGAPLDEEIRRLVVHGVLHLVGYDDTEAEQAERMRNRQEDAVRANPDPVLEGAR